MVEPPGPNSTLDMCIGALVRHGEAKSTRSPFHSRGQHNMREPIRGI
jgi:hypothetical protein